MNRRKVLATLAGATAGITILPSSLVAKGNNLPNKTNVVYASQTGAKLDSDAYTGGGTDDTKILQAVLDKAPEMGGIYLIMDGVALVSGLKLHANTTIECLNKSCGFFLKEQSNCAIVTNKNWSFSGERKDVNITLIGGTYNHNCMQQEHHIPNTIKGAEVLGADRWMFSIEFFGVENLNVRDITIRDQRTFAFVILNWKHVNIENMLIDIQNYLWAQNQDGIHVFGPGEFLNMKNISGNAGDDFIAIAPDELDHVSSISNVVIDGVFLDQADQGVRLLSRSKGRLDQVIVRNVMGSYKSFGFYIDHWFEGEGGDYGSILIENVNLKQLEANYHYTKPFLFRIAGKFENLTLRNIIHQHPTDTRSIIDVGWPEPDGNHKFSSTYVKSLLIDGLQILDNDAKNSDVAYIKVNTIVDNLIIRNVEVLRSAPGSSTGRLVEVYKNADVKVLFAYNIFLNAIRNLILNKGKIGSINLNNLMNTKSSDTFIRSEGGVIGKVTESAISGGKVR